MKKRLLVIIVIILIIIGCIFVVNKMNKLKVTYKIDEVKEFNYMALLIEKVIF